MAFDSKVDQPLKRPFRHQGAFGVLTLTGNYTLLIKDGACLRIDPGGSARDVTLEEDYQRDGMCVEITNIADAAENLVVKDPGGTTIVTISQNEKAKIAYTGSAWVHFGIVTIALS